MKKLETMRWCPCSSVFQDRAELICLVLLFFSLLTFRPANSDEYDSVLHSSQSGKVVNVIVTPGWGSVVGDDPDWLSIGEMQKKIIDAASKTGGEVEKVRRYRLLPVVSMTLDRAAIESLRANNSKALIWRDGLNKATLAESVQLVNAPKLWTMGLTGKGQFVAVIDTGVDSQHPFLQGKVASQYEACFSPTECPNGKLEMLGPGAGKASNSHGSDSHGTHVSGIIAGENSKIRGIAPDTKIIAVNVFHWERKDKTYYAFDSDITAGIDYAVWLKREKGVNIVAINLSLGGGFHSAPCEGNKIYEKAAELALSEGIIIVASSGNSKKNRSTSEYKYGVGSPACVPGILSVGAVDKKLRVTNFSQGAAFLDIVAPGQNIVSSTTGNPSYQAFNGTSMAAPHVAGAIAIMRQAKPNATVAELVTALKNSGRAIVDPYLDNVKTRVLDLDAALSSIGYRVEMAPVPQPQPTSIQAPIQTPPLKSSSENSGGWGAIQ